MGGENIENYFAEIIETHAEEMSDHPAYVFMGEKKSYKEFNNDANRVARSLLDMGLESGDRVATVLPQSPAFWNLYMAASKTGIEIVALDPRHKPPEMLYRLNQTGADILVGLGYPEDVAESIKKTLDDIDIEHVFSYFQELDVENSKSFETLLDSSSDPIPEKYHPEPEDTLIIIFTSGTTGKPKGALLTQRSVEAMSRAEAEMWNIKSSDSLLAFLPPNHVGGVHCTGTSVLYPGGTLFLMPQFDPEDALERVEKQDIKIFGGVPTIYRLIMNQVEDWEDYDRSSVRLAVMGGEPSSQKIVERVQKLFPESDVAVAYGCTEVSGFITWSRPEDSLDVAGKTEGTPGPGFEVKIIKEDGTEAETGEPGEIWVKGDCLMKGYLDEEKTEEDMEDNWFRTRDMGYLDDDGYLHYVGRSHEMFISGGYNVYPLEIESYLNKHSKVSNSFVTGVPDETWGEVGWAFILPEKGSEIDEEELEEYCEEGLSDYKIPKKFIIREEFPRTDVGKIDKQKLREEIDKD